VGGGDRVDRRGRDRGSERETAGGYAVRVK
jgi:hypothetical protein